MFNKLESDILEGVGKGAADIEARSNFFLREIREKTTAAMIKGKFVHKVIDNDQEGSKSFAKKTKGKFRKEDLYSEEEIKGQLMMSIYEDVVKPPGEWDFLLFLEDYKTVINVEVKKQIDLDGRKTRNLNKSLHSASDQTTDHAMYASRVFAPFLSDQWSFLKLAAILPGKLNDDAICSSCKRFVIVGNTNQEIEQNFRNIKTLLETHLTADPQEVHEDFINLFYATVGLSSLSMSHSDVGRAWRQIQGPLCDNVLLSAGWTKCDGDELLAEDLKFKDVLNQPHNLNKLLYFSASQLMPLTNGLPFVVLIGDFGSGKNIKTFIRYLKHMWGIISFVLNSNDVLSEHIIFSGKSLILKEMAIRKSKKISVKNKVSEDEADQDSEEVVKDSANVEEENSFLTEGFGYFDLEEHNNTVIPPSKEEEENNFENKKNKKGKSKKKVFEKQGE